MGDWQTIELALLVAIEMYSHNLNTEALEFIENCCFDSINSSEDPLHLLNMAYFWRETEKSNLQKKLSKKV